MKKKHEMEPKYDFKAVESGKYAMWREAGYFTATGKGKPFTIILPPPNITGKLHLGHAFDTALQDIIIRRKRMQGYDTLFLPGMDHASIATQVKIEKMLRDEHNVSRYDLGRDKFMEVAWQWKHDHADEIAEQWGWIGLSLDYTRERFTLDEDISEVVQDVFIKMYRDGIIYRGERIINWDVESQTALSNVEVIYHDVEGAFYYFKYPFVNGNDGLTIATTRPETMFGDQALMVHPDDERFKQYIGQEVYIPGTKVKIPVIADAYVDPEFGTGIVKVTPAHDPNDFEVGERHQLARPLCMNEDGTMNALAFQYEGLDRFECRKQVVKDLDAKGLLVKIEPLIHAVGHSERTGVVVEPRLSKQWFVNMAPLVESVIKEQNDPDKKVYFVPSRFENTFLNWLNNIQDWCISRQLWWGHRIPAWHRGEEVYVGKTAPEGEGWVQDEDVLDTWFSSALWPFSTLGWPKQTADFKRYFPNDVLVTGYDIIFFWVARMVFQSKYLTGKRPFKDVVIHGMIRDEEGRKFSKSLGNGVEMVDVINQYGADAMRYFLTTAATPGLDVRFSDEKMEASWNFINKLWNISRFVGINLDEHGYQGEAIDISLLDDVDRWILSELNHIISQSDELFERYDFGEVARLLYKFIWDDFASWYVEMTKVAFNEGSQAKRINTCAVLNYVLEAILKLMHPFIPFVTEDIYQKFYDGSIMVAAWPEVNSEYNFASSDVPVLFEIITAIRNLRAEKGISHRQAIALYLEVDSQELYDFLERLQPYLKRFTNYQTLHLSTEKQDVKQSVAIIINRVVIQIPLATLLNLEEELARLRADLAKMEAEILRCERMLNNPNFLAKAPESKVAEEQAKLVSYQNQKQEIQKMIAELQ